MPRKGENLSAQKSETMVGGILKATESELVGAET